MTMITVEGRYRDGKIDLAETPAGVSEARVLITFLPTEVPPKEPHYITFGQLRVEGRPMSTEEDFKVAEWRPTQESWMANRYIVDAHALIWYLEGNPKLGLNAKTILDDRGTNLILPAIALAEACYIVDRGRVSIVSSYALPSLTDADPRIQVVPLDRQVIQRTLRIPSISEMHDRQIVATALLLMDQGESVAILTIDANISASGLVPIFR